MNLVQYCPTYNGTISSLSKTSPYRVLCDYFGLVLIDRTRTLIKPPHIAIFNPLPLLGDSHKDNSPLNLLCDSRGVFIVQRALHENRPIHLFWSGGIDSTAALIAILKARSIVNKSIGLKVFYSKESISEFPTFYHQVVEPLPKKLIKRGVQYHLDRKAITVTGEHGDQLFGSDKIEHFLKTQNLWCPYEEVFEYAINRKSGSLTNGQEVLNWLKPQLDLSPIPIANMFDLLWWLNFTMKWQNVSFRLINKTRSPSRYTLEDNVCNFYQTNSFQHWSMTNHHLKIKDTWESYKYPLKEYIYDFFPDLDYLQNKTKMQSLKNVF